MGEVYKWIQTLSLFLTLSHTRIGIQYDKNSMKVDTHQSSAVFFSEVFYAAKIVEICHHLCVNWDHAVTLYLFCENYVEKYFTLTLKILFLKETTLASGQKSTFELLVSTYDLSMWKYCLLKSVCACVCVTHFVRDVTWYIADSFLVSHEPIDGY